MNFKAGDKIHGFTVKYTQYIDEIKATLVRMGFDKNGADLIWLDRDDTNKTFIIGFKTVPTDSTGLPHILEHSVLCGSDKYPVKEPFVEMLRSSLATFLNAFTFPDKTCYPVCSRSDKDFLNLMDVYLDAVFHPLSIKDPHAYRQEGWHYEPDEKNGWIFNGVVYNEMKGATSGADGVLDDAIMSALFPDNTYGVNSGGLPKEIPNLTFEQYCEFHRKFYSPTNSRILLDGTMDIDSVLAKIESFLCDFDYVDVDSDIPMQKVVTPDEKTEYYEVSQDEDVDGKTITSRGFVTGIFSDYEETLALQMISEVLCGSNEAPLTKAILDKKLAENVEFSVQNGIQQVMATITARNIKEEDKDDVWKVIDETLDNIVKSGLNREQLHSVLNRMEFSAREKDFNRFPKGLVFALNAFDSWLYGGDPADTLTVEEKYASLNKKIDEGWFEKILDEKIIRNKHRAQIVLKPSKTIGEERRAEELARARIRTKDWTEEQKAEARAQFEELRKKQEAPDTKEALATLPKLSLSDVPEKVDIIPQNVKEIAGIKVLSQPLDTTGITYLNLYFDMKDIELEDLSAASFLATLAGSLATEKHDVNGLDIELNGKLGRFVTEVGVLGNGDDPESCNPYFVVRLSLLENKKAEAVSLIDEILNMTKYDDANYIRSILKQNITGMQQSIMMNGNSYASMEAMESMSLRRAADVKVRGIGKYKWLKSIDENYDENGEAVCGSLAALAKKIFVKERLTIGITGEMDDKFAADVIGVIKDGSIGERIAYKPVIKKTDAYKIPTDIGFAGKAVKAGNYSGTAVLASQILILEYLWNEVRVKGGAYGTSMSSTNDGIILMNSFRDPSPANTLKTFSGAGEALRAFCKGDEPIDKYVISTISKMNPLSTPKTAGGDAEGIILSGRTQEERQKIYDEILSSTPDKLIEYSYTIDKITSNDAKSCIVSGNTGIEAAMNDKLVSEVEQI